MYLISKRYQIQNFSNKTRLCDSVMDLVFFGNELHKYKSDITNAYNVFIDYCSIKIVQLDNTEEDLKDVYVNATIQVKKRLIECYKRLKVVYEFTDKFS